jgi:hypothetical protein
MPLAPGGIGRGICLNLNLKKPNITNEKEKIHSQLPEVYLADKSFSN